jgi:hypothetical protein
VYPRYNSSDYQLRSPLLYVYQNYWSQTTIVCAVRIERNAVSKRDAIGCINDACSQIIRPINMACGCLQITSFRVQMTNGLLSPLQGLRFSQRWDIPPCSPLKVNRRYGGTYRLHLQGRGGYQRENRWHPEQSAGRKRRRGPQFPLARPWDRMKALVSHTATERNNRRQVDSIGF